MEEEINENLKCPNLDCQEQDQSKLENMGDGLVHCKSCGEYFEEFN